MADINIDGAARAIQSLINQRAVELGGRICGQTAGDNGLWEVPK